MAAAFGGLLVLWPVLAVIAVLVRLDSPGPAIHWSRRVGRDNRLFPMPKFRTMRTDTPDVATH
ncbi:MAG TPA: sugar transferase, partial [Phenylobacterium sp.]|nr:sugar transferase [Phenylobacterium sp.]